MDLCNLEQGIRELEAADCRMLHVDILDGYFSPSMPIGLDVVRQLRAKTDMFFDAHVMAMTNDFFIEELLDIGMQRLCFQLETERHVSKKLSLIRERGVKAGIALSPATPVAGLEYALELCDFVLLMMINPGFASQGGEAKYGFMDHKIAALREIIEKKRLAVDIALDGRVRKEDMAQLAEAGANVFVVGSSSLFAGTGSLTDNFRDLANHVEAL